MNDGGTSSTRAGRYVRQPSGYREFIPEVLPPKPPVRITDELQRLLSEADRALGRLDGSIQILPDADIFIYMYVRNEAVLSSQIEGTQSSLQDLLVAEAEILAPNRRSDVNDVVNYVNAMNYGLERLSTLSVSSRLIREIHAILLKGVRGSQFNPGEFRTTQNWVGPAGCTIGEATFVPPPPSELGQAMSDLERFVHFDSDLPLLIKIGLLHAQFETIHPFLDGNGRVGRLLITFLLCQQEVLTKPVLYLSYYFKRHRQRYYEELQAVRDGGAWEEWLAFFLRGVAEVSGQATDTARRILALRERHHRAIMDRFGLTAGNGYRVLEHLYTRPVVSVDDVRELIGTTYSTANNLVTRLVENGILREFTGQARNRAFIYQSYLSLFHETEPDGDV